MKKMIISLLAVMILAAGTGCSKKPNADKPKSIAESVTIEMDSSNNLTTESSTSSEEDKKSTEESKPQTPTTSQEQLPSTPKATDPIDIQIYLDYAYECADKMGLVVDENLLGLSWNAWINLYTSLSDVQMKTNIKDGLQILKDEGRTYFKLHTEFMPDKSYRLYILYG